MTITTQGRDNARQVKDMIREPFAFPGGYSKFAVTALGECLCLACVRAEAYGILHSTLNRYADALDIRGVDIVAAYDAPFYCDCCGGEIAETAGADA